MPKVFITNQFLSVAIFFDMCQTSRYTCALVDMRPSTHPDDVTITHLHTRSSHPSHSIFTHLTLALFFVCLSHVQYKHVAHALSVTHSDPSLCLFLHAATHSLFVQSQVATDSARITHFHPSAVTQTVLQAVAIKTAMQSTPSSLRPLEFVSSLLEKMTPLEKRLDTVKEEEPNEETDKEPENDEHRFVHEH